MQQQAVIDLAEQLDAAEVTAPTPSYVELQTFVIDRIARTSIFQHPPSRITWRNLAVGAKPKLRFYPAIKPAVWDKLGTPIVFRVHVIIEGVRLGSNISSNTAVRMTVTGPNDRSTCPPGAIGTLILSWRRRRRPVAACHSDGAGGATFESSISDRRCGKPHRRDGWAASPICSW
jgi:hypothetical protein